jgi:two-component system, NarL family, invasion response regulator UvrY
MRILIADDHAIVRRGLKLIISETSDLLPVAEVGTDELLAALRASHVDLVVLNVSFAHNGLDVLRGVKSEFPGVPVLVMNLEGNDLLVIRALRAGASGYVQKECTPEELLVAARRVAGGGTYLSSGIAEKIAAELRSGAEGRKPHERLSRRELEIFRLLGSGKPVGEIARKLKLSVKTVSTHRARIIEKTGLRNNADIIRYAIVNQLF